MGLAWLLREHGEVLEADFQREYHIALSDDLASGALRPTRAAKLAMGLKPGAMTWRVLGGPLAWSDETHFLAAIEWRLQILAWQKTEDGKKGKNPPKPVPPPSPAHEEQSKDSRMAQKRAALLERAAGQR